MGVLNIYDVMLVHNVPAYIATRKWRVLKVTPQVGAESAVYGCLVPLVDGSGDYTRHTVQPLNVGQNAPRFCWGQVTSRVEVRLGFGFMFGRPMPTIVVLGGGRCPGEYIS